MDQIKCSLHNIAADTICLNQKCNQKKITCQKCFEEDSLKPNCKEDHSQDVLELSELKEENINQFYNSYRKLYLDDMNYLYKSVVNLNKLKFEELGRNFYDFLQQQSLRGFKAKREESTIEQFDELISSNTSQCRFRKILNTFITDLLNSQQVIQEYDQDQIDEELITNNENKLLNQLSDNLQNLSSDLVKCQNTIQIANRYQESYTPQDLESLTKKLKNIVKEFVEKKIKKKTKTHRVTQQTLADLESKLLIDVPIPQYVEIPLQPEIPLILDKLDIVIQESDLQNIEAAPMEIEQCQATDNVQNEIQI